MLFERSELCSRPERSELIQLKCPSKRAQGAARSGEISIFIRNHKRVFLR
jgi:hypothetical protein